MSRSCRPVWLWVAVLSLGASVLDASMITPPPRSGAAMACAWRFEGAKAVTTATPLAMRDDRLDGFVPLCDITGETAAWGRPVGSRHEPFGENPEMALTTEQRSLPLLPSTNLDLISGSIGSVMGDAWECLTLGDRKVLSGGMTLIMAYDSPTGMGIGY